MGDRLRAGRSDVEYLLETARKQGLTGRRLAELVAHADEFHDWYDLEHIPERLRVPLEIGAAHVFELPRDFAAKNGLGGVLVEVMKDVTFRMAPVGKKDALSMLDSVGASEVLRGVRGQKGVDRAALADIICKVSKLVNDFPEIHEVDLNPIFATEKGAHAVDAQRIRGMRPGSKQFSSSYPVAEMSRIRI